MLRLVLLAMFACACAVAAPVPPESDRERVARLWGQVRAPSRHYIVKPQLDLLTLRTIGWPVGFGFENPTFLVQREVRGDFDARVKLYDLDTPSRGLPYNDSPQTAAGLHVAGGECSISLYRWKAIHKNNGVLQDGMQDTVWLTRRTRNSGMGSSLQPCEAGKSHYLRLIRNGDALRAYLSTDGASWKDWDAGMKGLSLPPVVTIGIFVGHTTSQEVAATFEGFAVEKAK